jgi:hypothetical protein
VHLLATISLNKQNQTDLSGELRQFQLIIDSLYMSIKTLTQYLQVVVMLVILVWPDLSQYTKHYNFSLPYGIVLPLLLNRHLEPLTTVFCRVEAILDFRGQTRSNLLEPSQTSFSVSKLRCMPKIILLSV